MDGWMDGLLIIPLQLGVELCDYLQENTSNLKLICIQLPYFLD